MRYEIISSKLNLPIQINILQNEFLEKQFNKSPKLYLVMGETFKIEMRNSTYDLKSEELIFVNSNIIHSLDVRESFVIEIVVDTAYFSIYNPGFDNIIFDDEPLNVEKYGDKIDTLKKSIKSILKIYNKNSSNNYLVLLNLMISFAEFLMTNYMVDKNHKFSYIGYNNDKVRKAIEYIDLNYSDEINLNKMSRILGMNSQYLSRFFKQHLGVGFLTYLNKIRVKKSLKCLLNTNKSILEIAIDYGFNDSKNYTRAFKQEFSITPGEYRKSSKNDIFLIEENFDNNGNYNKEFFLKKIDEFIKEKDKEKLDYIDKSSIDFNYKSVQVSKKFPYKNSFMNIFSIERAYSLLRYDLQEQIENSYRELNFKYLKFAGIFNEEMMIYNEDEFGEVVYNWGYVDKIFDFLIKIGVKPFINIGYMPEQLASKKKYIFFYRANVSYPKSISRWNELLKHFVLHMIERYGKKEVETWYLEVWNNPNIEGMYWYENQNKYNILFKETFLTIKKILPNMKIGGPSIAINLATDQEETCKKWLINFLNYLNENEISIDFLSIHSYPLMPNTTEDDANSHILDKLRYKTFKGLNKAFIRDIDYMKEDIKFVEKIIKEKNYEDIPIILSEWNAEPSMESKINDTCFLALSIIYNTLNNFHRVEGMIYWTLSDIFEEYGHYKNIFHGNFGLLTSNGLKKASYNAYYLLSKLSENVVERTENYIVTKNLEENRYQILLFNYSYFDELTRLKLGSKGDFSYKSSENIKISLRLEGLEKGIYKIKTLYLNKDSGSVYDAYKKMGEPEIIDDEILKFLKSKEQMELKILKEDIKGSYTIHESLEPQSAILIELSKEFLNV